MPVEITQQPKDQSVSVGDEVTFTVVATGATTYQWYENSNLITGETSSTLTFIAGKYDNANVYEVDVGDGVETVTSSSATLLVKDSTATEEEEGESVTDCPVIDPYKANIATPTSLEAMRFWVQQELKQIERVFETVKDVLECLEDKSESTITELEDCCLPICDTELVPWETPGRPPVEGGVYCKEYQCDILVVTYGGFGAVAGAWEMGDPSGSASFAPYKGGEPLQAENQTNSRRTKTIATCTNTYSSSNDRGVFNHNIINTGSAWVPDPDSGIPFASIDRDVCIMGVAKCPGGDSGPFFFEFVHSYEDRYPSTISIRSFTGEIIISGNQVTRVRLYDQDLQSNTGNIFFDLATPIPAGTFSAEPFFFAFGRSEGRMYAQINDEYFEHTHSVTNYPYGSSPENGHIYDFYAIKGMILDFFGPSASGAPHMQDIGLASALSETDLLEFYAAYQQNFTNYVDPNPNCTPVGEPLPIADPGEDPQIGYEERKVTPKDGQILKWDASRDCWYYADECCPEIEDDCCFPWKICTEEAEDLVACKQYECDALEKIWRDRTNGDELFWPGFQWTRYPGIWSLKYWDAGGYFDPYDNGVSWNTNLRNYLAASPEQFSANITPPGAWAPEDIPKWCKDYGVCKLANVSQAFRWDRVPDPDIFNQFTVSGSYQNDLSISVIASAALWLSPSSTFKSANIFNIAFDGYHSYGFGTDVDAGLQDIGGGIARLKIGGVTFGDFDLGAANKLQMVTIAVTAADVPNPSFPTKNAYQVSATVYVDGTEVLSGSYTRYDSEGWNVYLVRLYAVSWYGSHTYGALFSVAGGNDGITVDDIYDAWQRQFENYVDPDPRCGSADMRPADPQNGDILIWEDDCFHVVNLSNAIDTFGRGTGSSAINDNKTSLTTTWSSAKLDNLLATKVDISKYSSEINKIHARLEHLEKFHISDTTGNATLPEIVASGTATLNTQFTIGAITLAAIEATGSARRTLFVSGAVTTDAITAGGTVTKTP